MGLFTASSPSQILQGPPAGTPGSGGPLGTPKWQGAPVGTPPNPLSSHPIDALEGSDFASASASTTDSGIVPSPALSDNHSRLLRAAPQPPDTAQHDPATATGSPVPTLGSEQPAWMQVNAQQEQQGSLGLSQGRQSLTAPSLPLDADAVMLELESDLSVSADGLISPASSTSSWPRSFATRAFTSSSRSVDIFASSPSATAHSLDRQPQSQTHPSIEDSFPKDQYLVTSRATATSPLLNESASGSVSSSLPASWYSHHQQQQKQLLRQQLHSQRDLSRQSSRHPNVPVLADFVSAAAQLRQAVAQAEQLYRASAQTACLSDAGGSLRVPSSGTDTAATEEEQSPAQGYLQQLPSALPQCRNSRLQSALRRSAEPASSLQQPLWVPQGIACALHAWHTCYDYAASASMHRNCMHQCKLIVLYSTHRGSVFGSNP